MQGTRQEEVSFRAVDYIRQPFLPHFCQIGTGDVASQPDANTYGHEVTRLVRTNQCLPFHLCLSLMGCRLAFSHTDDVFVCRFFFTSTSHHIHIQFHLSRTTTIPSRYEEHDVWRDTRSIIPLSIKALRESVVQVTEGAVVRSATNCPCERRSHHFAHRLSWTYSISPLVGSFIL